MALIMTAPLGGSPLRPKFRLQDKVRQRAIRPLRSVRRCPEALADEAERRLRLCVRLNQDGDAALLQNRLARLC